MTRIRTIATGAILALAMLALASSAFAAKRPEVRVTGTCTGASTSKLKLKVEDTGIQAQFEVDQNRVGVTWSWSFSRSGAELASGTAVTRAPSGSFSVSRTLSNAAGPDTIVATATRAGESCTAVATL
ncbi:MAG: hypothetical protein U0R50_06225 [Gaiellales bacterium]